MYIECLLSTISVSYTHLNIQLLPVMESIVYRYKIGFYDVSRKRGKVERKNKRNFD